MVSEQGGAINNTYDVGDALRKLGWLSAYARQALMSRHMLRNISGLAKLNDLPKDMPNRYPLDCFRAAITVMTGVNRESRKFSGPYLPRGSPNTHFLAYNRKRRIFEASYANGLPEITFHYSEVSAVGLRYFDFESVEDQIFVHEIYWLGKGVSLFNNSIADERITTLRDEKLWRGFYSQREEYAKRFFDQWYPSQPNVCSFWREWYQGFLDGKPMDWELQQRVALIDDAIWEAGPEAVAEEIERIRAAFLAEKTPQAERVEFNPETAKFYTVPIDVAKPDLLGATLTQVEDALEDALANPSNGLHDRAREVRVLRRAIGKYGNDPQQIEMSFVSVYAGLTRQILSDELPPSEENLALQAAVEEGARGIRATHPEVAENRKILSEQVIKELPEGAKETLKEALPVLMAISEPGLAEDWEHDIPTLINDATGPLPSGAPALPGADEATRIFSRVAKISLHLKVADVIHKIDGSAGYKAAGISLIVYELVKLGLAII